MLSMPVPRIWCFDVEARPGPWGGSDFTYKSMLSLAGGYDDEKDVAYLAPGFEAEALEDFVTPIRQGCLVVGHNAVRYDLPFLNGTLNKMGLESLPRLLVSDTMRHLPKNGYAYSRGLGAMASRFGLSQHKGSMNEYDWEQAYAGDSGALARLKEYNTNDVRATLALRRVLLNLDLLGPPKAWGPYAI